MVGAIIPCIIALNVNPTPPQKRTARADYSIDYVLPQVNAIRAQTYTRERQREPKRTIAAAPSVCGVVSQFCSDFGKSSAGDMVVVF
eukprot:scaffold4097_cov166-Amphora_coffeaeformis.AAC.54